MKFKMEVVASVTPYAESEVIYSTLSDDEKEYVCWEAISNWSPDDKFFVVTVYTSCGTYELEMDCGLEETGDWEVVE